MREHLGGNFPPFFILFLSVGLIAPHPIRGYLPSLFLLFILLILNLLVSLLFSDLVSAKKATLKAVWLWLDRHSPLFHLDILDFLLYNFVTLYSYWRISILLYSRIVIYTSIRIYNTVYCHIFTSMLYLRYFLYFTFPFI